MPKVLFGYPIEATSENWLHESLVHMIATTHRNIDEGLQPMSWVKIIPAQHLEKLRRRRKLCALLDGYRIQASTLSQDERSMVYRTLQEQNNLVDLLAGRSECKEYSDLPDVVQQPIKDLFEQAFSLLTDLGVRDRQYEIIHSQLRVKICPFCGCEFFDAPGAKREALDHYLAESKYPFAAANLNNLVPMGGKCNSRYKLAKNILYSANGDGRRAAFFPYNSPGLQVSLDRTCANSDDHNQVFSEWDIMFAQACAEVETWDAVFAIRERYQRDILNVEFNDWLYEFASWASVDMVSVGTNQELLQSITRYAQYLSDCGFRDRAFLKAAVFNLIYKLCAEGNERIIFIMRTLVTSIP
jgi:hypothetical protein